MMLPVKSIAKHAHNLYRMSSNLRSIAYDLHYCPGSKNYRRQNKMTFSPELYIIALKKWMVYVLYIFDLFNISEIFRKLKIMILAFHITLRAIHYSTGSLLLLTRIWLHHMRRNRFSNLELNGETVNLSSHGNYIVS
jgi:hypothetical protein